MPFLFKNIPSHPSFVRLCFMISPVRYIAGLKIDAVLELSMVTGLVSADVRRRFFQRFGKSLAKKPMPPSHTPAPSNAASSTTPATPSSGHGGHGVSRRNSRNSSRGASHTALEAATDRQDANLRAIFDKYAAVYILPSAGID